MTHISASVYTLWTIISVTFFGFLVAHLWKFDRFECLRFRGDRQSGAFKRMMTYTYLVSLPLIIVYSIGMMTIKYREGFSILPDFGIIPTPYQLWSPTDQALLMKFYMVFAFAWGLEIVTHLEELCFWLFLVNAGPSHATWFGSIHFKVWVTGSMLAVAGMPLVTWFTRANTLKCEAWTFLIGSTSSLIITLGGLRVLFVFPRFLNTVKSAGGDPEVVIRLTTFHDLNIIRVIFRFIFCVPLLALAIDGVEGHEHHINESALWTDLLASLGGVGMVTSSCLTLLIFFPRSIAREAGYRPKRKSSSHAQDEISLQPIDPENEEARATYLSQSRTDANPFAANAIPQTPPPPHAVAYSSTFDTKTSLADNDDHDFGYPTEGINPPSYVNNRLDVQHNNPTVKRQEIWEMVTSPSQIHLAATTPMPTPPGIGASFDTRTPIAGPSRRHRPELHPMLMNYSSPINVAEEPPTPCAIRIMHRPPNAV